MTGPLAYIGGKRRLAPQILRLLPPHTTYVEPFAGGAQVFFHKVPSRVEVLNDLDGDIVNFLRVCQHHSAELARWLRFAAASRKLFELFELQPVITLTDIQRAARFLYLQKNSFGGRRHNRSFHYAVIKPSNYSPERLPQLLAAAAQRLSAVQVESRPYEAILRHFDRPTTLFYCDPPYQGLRFYEYNFSDDEFAQLAERLSVLRGKFLLSINDTPVVRHIFRNFPCRQMSIAYSAHNSNPRVTELLFANFNLDGHVA
jgi:DNA adenine methylase